MSRSYLTIQKDGQSADLKFNHTDGSLEITVGHEQFEVRVKLNSELKQDFIRALLRLDDDAEDIAKELINKPVENTNEQPNLKIITDFCKKHNLKCVEVAEDHVPYLKIALTPEYKGGGGSEKIG